MLTLLVLLSLATYRITRLAISDSIFDTPRMWLHQYLLGKTSKVRWVFYQLITCQYCLSIWIAGLITLGASTAVDIDLPFLMWMASAGGSVIIWNATE